MERGPRQERLVAEWARPITAEVTEASTTTPKDFASKSRRISSRAKNTPAIGALNVAEMPPAAPQATSSRGRGKCGLAAPHRGHRD